MELLNGVRGGGKGALPVPPPLPEVVSARGRVPRSPPATGGSLPNSDFSSPAGVLS